MSLFCRHKWMILSEKTTESKIEHLKKLGYEACSGAKSHFLERQVISIFSCEKCGKIKKFVTEI